MWRRDPGSRDGSVDPASRRRRRSFGRDDAPRGAAVAPAPPSLPCVATTVATETRAAAARPPVRSPFEEAAATAAPAVSPAARAPPPAAAPRPSADKPAPLRRAPSDGGGDALGTWTARVTTFFTDSAADSGTGNGGGGDDAPAGAPSTTTSTTTAPIPEGDDDDEAAEAAAAARAWRWRFTRRWRLEQTGAAAAAAAATGGGAARAASLEEWDEAEDYLTACGPGALALAPGASSGALATAGGGGLASAAGSLGVGTLSLGSAGFSLLTSASAGDSLHGGSAAAAALSGGQSGVGAGAASRGPSTSARHHQPRQGPEATRDLARVARRAATLVAAQARIAGDLDGGSGGAAANGNGARVSTSRDDAPPPWPLTRAAVDLDGAIPFILARVDCADGDAGDSGRLVVRGRAGASEAGLVRALEAEAAAAAAAAGPRAPSSAAFPALPRSRRPVVTLVGAGALEWARGRERHALVRATRVAPGAARAGCSSLAAVAQAAAGVLRGALPLTHRVTAC